MVLVKNKKYLEEVSTYDTNSLQEFIEFLQGRKYYWQEIYPNAVIEIQSQYDSEELDILAVEYYKDATEWAEDEKLKEEIREREQEKKDRETYEKLHAKFNKS